MRARPFVCIPMNLLQAFAQPVDQADRYRKLILETGAAIIYECRIRRNAEGETRRTVQINRPAKGAAKSKLIAEQAECPRRDTVEITLEASVSAADESMQCQ